jgi:fumarylacetoacetase
MTAQRSGPAGEARETLPYGVFSTPGRRPRIGVKQADSIVDLAAAARAVDHPQADVFSRSSLNALMDLGPARWAEVRRWVRSLAEGAQQTSLADGARVPLADATLHLPIEVADYVDFYASEAHASNVGALFRPDSPGLPPNWKHLPIGYHGRAGTVVVSGTEVIRPCGQGRPGDDGRPTFGPSQRLDIECEVGFVVGAASRPGHPVAVADARDHIFGVVLLNDWSARDIQAWEYVPLGPFLGKSFATSISAWVVPFSELAAAEIPLGEQRPAVLPYLSGTGDDLFGLDLTMTVSINGRIVSSPRFRDMYWSPAQLLAHLTVNGAHLRVGDLVASGTVSGPQRDTLGSLLELTWNATRPAGPEDGAPSGFLADGDEVTITGWAPGLDGDRVELGEVSGRVVPAAC